MRSMQQILNDTHHSSELAYRSYAFDQILCDQTNSRTKITNSNLEKKYMTCFLSFLNLGIGASNQPLNCLSNLSRG